MSEPLKHIDELFRENQRQFDKKPSDAAWSRLDTMLDQVEDKEVIPEPKANYRIWLSIAATVLLCLGGWWMSQALLTSSSNDHTMAESRSAPEPMMKKTEKEVMDNVAIVEEGAPVDLANEPVQGNATNANNNQESKPKVKKALKPVAKDVIVGAQVEEITEVVMEEESSAVFGTEDADVVVNDVVIEEDFSDGIDKVEEVFAYDQNESVEEELEAGAVSLDELAVTAPTAPTNAHSRTNHTFKIQNKAKTNTASTTSAIPQIIWMEGTWAAANGAIVLEITQKDSKTYEVIWKENGKTLRSIFIESIDGNPLSIQVHQHNMTQTSYDFVLSEANESFNTLRFNNDDAFIKLKSLVNGDLRWTEKSPFGKKMYMFKLQ